MWVVGQVVGLELWVKWVVVCSLVGFYWLFDGGSFGFGTLGVVCVTSMVAPLMVFFFLNGFARICGVLVWFELMV